jgi:hypothetical protein
MPEAVLHALRRFEIGAPTNVHEGMHRRVRAATDAYHEARRHCDAFTATSLERRAFLSERHAKGQRANRERAGDPSAQAGCRAPRRTMSQLIQINVSASFPK